MTKIIMSPATMQPPPHITWNITAKRRLALKLREARNKPLILG
ncbi:MAG TPA: hypothetical protein PLO16_13715 [Acidocella sp.]|nr:hypothetical protein [Acidocella sp.]